MSPYRYIVVDTPSYRNYWVLFWLRGVMTLDVTLHLRGQK